MTDLRKMDFEAEDVVAVVVTDELTGELRIAWNVSNLPSELDKLTWIASLGVELMLKAAEATILAESGPEFGDRVH